MIIPVRRGRDGKDYPLAVLAQLEREVAAISTWLTKQGADKPAIMLGARRATWAPRRGTWRPLRLAPQGWLADGAH
jgi:hypothetical protein